MKQESILYGVIGLLAGALITFFAVGQPAQQPSPLPVSQTVGMDKMMEGMMGQSGENLEQKFLEAMIVHHQGAVKMAQEIKQGSKRRELVRLANDIISAQTKEIEMMQIWQQQWWSK